MTPLDLSTLSFRTRLALRLFFLGTKSRMIRSYALFWGAVLTVAYLLTAGLISDDYYEIPRGSPQETALVSILTLANADALESYSRAQKKAFNKGAASAFIEKRVVEAWIEAPSPKVLAILSQTTLSGVSEEVRWTSARWSELKMKTLTDAGAVKSCEFSDALVIGWGVSNSCSKMRSVSSFWIGAMFSFMACLILCPCFIIILRRGDISAPEVFDLKRQFNQWLDEEGGLALARFEKTQLFWSSKWKALFLKRDQKKSVIKGNRL